MGGSRIPKPSECFPTAVELFKHQFRRYDQMAPPPPRAPATTRHPSPITPERILPDTRPGLETIPTHVMQTGLAPASATVLREHARRMKRSTVSTPNNNQGPTSAQTLSLAKRLRAKFERMMQKQQQPEVDLEAYDTAVRTTTSLAAQHEWQHDVTSTVLYWLAKGLHMDPRRLESSPALRELLQPYLQCMGNAPCWMQFAGLLAAKKCQDWTGMGMIMMPDDMEMQTDVPVDTIPPPPPTSDAPGVLIDDDRWMSIEYIDVDAVCPETAEKDNTTTLVEPVVPNETEEETTTRETPEPMDHVGRDDDHNPTVSKKSKKTTTVKKSKEEKAVISTTTSNTKKKRPAAAEESPQTKKPKKSKVTPPPLSVDS